MPEQLVEIEGIEEVCDLLEHAPRELVPGALLNGLRAGAAVIETTIAAGCVRNQTGEMKDGLGIRITLDSDFRGGRAEIGFTGWAAAKANWIEYGHHMIGHKPDKKDLGEVQAYPFMRPAADASQEAAVDAMAETMLNELQGGKLVDAA